MDLLDGTVTIEKREFGTFEDPLSLEEDLFFSDQDIRVFMLNMYSDHARSVLCQVCVCEGYVCCVCECCRTGNLRGQKWSRFHFSM